MNTNSASCHFCSIVPPHILKEITRRGSRGQKELALQTLIQSEQFRGLRSGLGILPFLMAVPVSGKWRTVYDAEQRSSLPGRLVREEGYPKSRDIAVNEAYDGAGAHYDFFKKVYGRDSLDNKGFQLDSSVHYGRNYDNAFWNGRQMVYGDGDGDLFDRFTKALDVIGHELTHGIVQFEANLTYEGQSGALNESFADVFGSLVKQYKNGQKAGEADWLIGEGLLKSKVQGKALRSMKAPGTAYDDPVLGKDPQPAHMKDYVETQEDNGGVHLNSGIPNRAFYETAIRLGGYAWKKAGQIWYVALRDRLKANSNFEDAAKITFAVAGELFGKSGKEAKAVKEAWHVVGIAKNNLVFHTKHARNIL